nr:hypothetical protein [Kofleriaceae bacterium]
MAAPDEGGHARRGHSDAKFLSLDLFGDADAHVIREHRPDDRTPSIRSLAFGVAPALERTEDRIFYVPGALTHRAKCGEIRTTLKKVSHG